MSKQLMVSAIVSRLASMGIQYLTGGSADVLVNHEFLSAGWSTGNKKISYQASAFLNENDTTVYLWELTTETGSGFSFGGSNETSFQSGKTIFRKVKSVQYGVDGKAYEIEIDLGAIPKLFKETAQQYGWSFKTVLKKDKASYPAGMAYMPPQQPLQQQFYAKTSMPPQNQSAANSPGQNTQPPQQPQYSQPQQPQYAQSAPQQYYEQPNLPHPQYNQQQGGASGKNSGKAGVLFYIAFAFLALATLVFMVFGKNSVTGWAIAVVFLVLYFFLGKRFSANGFLTQIFLLVVTVVILLLNFTLTSPSDKQNNSNNGTTQNNKTNEKSKFPAQTAGWSL